MVISPVPEILERMAEGETVTAAAMHDRLSRDFDLGEREAAMAQIGAHLDALVALGLVRPA